MRTIKGKTFGEERLVVDGLRFEDCTFNGTIFVFTGGEMPVFAKVAFNGIGLDFEGAAYETIKLLRQFTLIGGGELVQAHLRLAKSAVN